MSEGGVLGVLRFLRGRAQVAPRGAGAALRELEKIGAAEKTAGGWRRTYRPEFLSEKKLRAALDGAGGVKVLGETESSSAEARRLAGAAALPLFCFAEHQTGGRGRRGKRWLALPGDAVMFSAVFVSPPSVAGLSVAAGAALWRGLCGDARLRLKWPNDLLDAAGNKVGGILTEVAGGKLIIGVGLNRRMTPALAAEVAKLGGAPAGGLHGVLPPAPRFALAAGAAKILSDAVRKFSAGGFAAFADLAGRASGGLQFNNEGCVVDMLKERAGGYRVSPAAGAGGLP